MGFILTMATCRDGMEPQVHLAPIAVAPILPSDAALAQFGLTIDRIRFIVIRPSASPDTLADTTVAIPPDSTTLELDLRVPLIAAEESLQVSIVVLSGSIALFEGTAMVLVSADEPPATPTEIPVQTYVGPGAGVDSIAISPAQPFLFFNDSLRFQVEAFQAGAPVTQFFVSWSTSDTNVARVNGAGLLRAPASRTSVRVIARTPGGAVDSTPVTFVPVPTQMLVISGDGQSAPVGQALAAALEVEIRAADNLPVGGVGVRFQALSGGTPADTIVVTDAAGRARVTGVLGSTPGAQSFRASVPGFPGVAAHTFPATAVGSISPTTSIITTSAGSVASGGGVTLTLQGKDGAGNNITAGGATVIFSASGGTSTGTIAPSPATDNGNGTYTATFTGVVAGSATTIGATINGSPVTTLLPTVAVNAGPLVSVVATPDSISLAALGQTQQYSASGRDASGNPVATTVTWSASTPAVAGISTGGLATALANGTTAIIATAPGGQADTVTLTVQQVVTSIVVTPSADTIHALSNTAAFAAVARDANDSTVAAESFTWSSSDTAIASVDAAGLTTALGNGNATITAQAASNGTSGTAVVVVAQVVSSVTVAPPVITLTSLGATQLFTAVARDSNAFLIAGATFTWSSSAPTVATVDASGNATAVLNGSTRIVAASAGIADSVDLFVSQIATQLAFTVQPSTAAAGTPITPNVEVTVQDSLGSAVATYTDSITIAIGTNPVGGILSGTLKRETVSGRVTFDDLRINQPGSGYTLTATAAGLPVATSTAFAIAPPASVVFWTNPAGGNWSSPANWTGGAVPALGDTAVISLAGSYTVTFDVSDTVGGVRLGGAGSTPTLLVSNKEFGVGGAFRVDTGAVLDMRGSSVLSGLGGLTNLSTIKLRQSIVAKPLANAGAIYVDGSTSLTGIITTTTTSFIRVQGNNVTGFSQLSAAPFTNNGQIVLTDSASASGAALNVSAPFTNAAGAVLNADLGAGGPRQINAPLDNQGTFTVGVAPGQAVSLAAPVGDPGHSNSGSIVISSGKLSITQAGPSFTFTSSGSIDAGGGSFSIIQPAAGSVTLSGSLTIGAADTFSVQAGTFNYASGAVIGGRGTVALKGGVSANFTPSFSNDTMGLVLQIATLNGPGTVTNAAGRTIKMRGTINAPFVNNGTLLVDGTSGLGGSVTTGSGSLIRVQGNNVVGFSHLTVANGFINNGQILLTDSASASGSQLDVTNGTLTNSGSATIVADLGSGGNRQLNAALDNQGTITVSVDSTRFLGVAKANAAHLNTGTITIASGALTINQSGTSSFGQSGTLDASGGNFTLTQAASGSFTLTGNVLIGANRVFTIGAGTFAYNAAAALEGTGTVLLQGGVVATFGKSFSNDTLGLRLNGATVNGTGTLTNVAGRTMLVRTGTIGVPLVNHGSLLADGTSAINGSVTTSGTSLIRVQGNNVVGFSRLTLASGFTNNGQILLTDSASGSGAALDVTAGALVNAASAAIQADSGGGGPRQLNALLDNQGLVVVNPAPGQLVTVSKASAAHQNSGTLRVARGTLSVSGAGASLTNVSGGVVEGSGVLSMPSLTFTNGGVVKPGTAGTGILKVVGNYVQSAAGTLSIELGGLTPGTQYDRLVDSAGTATLSGALSVTLVNGFTPAVGDSFTVLTFPSRTGSIPTLSGLDIGGGVRLDTVYTGTELRLVAVVLQTSHTADITTDETWAAASNPHVVSGYLKVRNGATLTIEDGALVKFDSAAGLQLGDTALGESGGLIMQAAAPSGITLTANTATPAPGFWRGIEVQQRVNNPFWRNVLIEYGGGARPNPFNEACLLVVNGAGAPLVVESFRIRQCVHAAIHHFGGTLTVRNTQIDSVTGSGIHADFGAVLELDSTTIRGSGQEGLFIGSSTVDLVGATANKFFGNAVAGVHLFARQLPGFGLQDSLAGNGFAGGSGDSIVVDSGTIAVPAFTIVRQPAPYLFTGLVNVWSPAGTTVSLDTGLVIAFDTSAALSVGDFADQAGTSSGVTGTLVSLGTAANPVVLQTRQGRPGWQGLYLGSQSGIPVVRHLRLTGGGYRTQGAFCSQCLVKTTGFFEPLNANLYVDAPLGTAPFIIDSVVSDSSRFIGVAIKRTPPEGLRLRNSTIQHATFQGLAVRAQYNPKDTIDGNTITGNEYPVDIVPEALPALGFNVVMPNVRDTLLLRGGALVAPDTLPQLGPRWRVLSSVSVDSGAALFVLAGDTVFFDDSVSLTIGGAAPSALRALGTSLAPILFTATPGYAKWDGLIFANLSGSANLANSTVRNLIIERAGQSIPCFGDCNPTPVAAVRYANVTSNALTLDSVTIRQSVTMALDVDSGAGSPVAVQFSQFYDNQFSPMIKSRNPTLLSIHGSDLYHYNAQIIQTANAGVDSIDAQDNWWGDVAGLARGFQFSDSLGRAALWFNAVRFEPFQTTPRFAVGPAAQIVAARDTLLNSGFGLNAIIGDPDSIRVRVLDAQGRGVPTYDVQWGTSTGSFGFVTSLTEVSGRVGGVWTTGTVAGDHFVQAVAPGLTGSPVNFRTTLQPDPTVSTNWQLVPSLTQGTVSADSNSAIFTSSNRSSALVSNAVDQYGNRTSPTSGFFFTTVPNSGFQPFGQVDSIHGDTVFFRALVSNPSTYQVHGLYDGGLLQDSLFITVTAQAAGIRISQDTTTFVAICPTDPANIFCERPFWAEVVDSAGAALPPSAAYQFTWTPDPAGLITIRRTGGVANDTVLVTARGNGATWITVDEVLNPALSPNHDSLAIAIQQIAASVLVQPDTISARIGDALIFRATPRDLGGTQTADTIHWAEDVGIGKLTFLDTTSVLNQATVRLDSASFGTANVLTFVNGSLLGFAQIYNPVHAVVPGVGNETNGIYVNAGLTYVATDTGVAVISSADNIVAFIPIPEPTYYLAHDVANNRIYAGARSTGTVYVIDGFTNTLRRNFNVNPLFVPQMAVDESTGNLLVPTVICVGSPCSDVDFLGVFDSVGVLIDTVRIGDQGVALAFDQAARTAFVGVFAGPRDSIKVVDLATSKAVDSIEVGSSLANLAFNPVTRMLYASDYVDNAVYIIDAASRTVRNLVAVGVSPEGIAIDTIRNKLYIANTSDPTIYVIDGASEQIVQFINVPAPTSQAAVWQGGNQLYVNTYGGRDVRILKF